MPHALVVEDDAEIARFFQLVLQEASFDVEVITNGQDALERLMAVIPDLVILDLNIPFVTGLEVLHRVRADNTLAGVKVIVVSANPHMTDQVGEQADLILQKPVSYEQLRNLVQRII
jgi:two-component system cell cycle response regulator DivK